MKIQDLKDLVFEAYVEILREENENKILSKEEILIKFPTLLENIKNLFTVNYQPFIKDIKYTAPKPSTFTIVISNNQEFYLKWMGKGFEAQIEGKKYYLDRVDESQQALDKITELLKYAPLKGEEEPVADEFGGETGGDTFGAETGGIEEPPAEEPAGGEEVAFEEEPTT